MKKYFLLMNLYFFSFSFSNQLNFMRVKNSPGSPLRKEFLQMIQNLFHTNVFVETGTFLGNTTANAIPFFKEIYTIELSKNLYNKAVQRFKNNNKIKVLLGNTTTVLAKILPGIKNKKICFWLDAHYSGGTTAGSVNTLPILKELEIIKNNNLNSSIILIDDIRCFYNDKHSVFNHVCLCDIYAKIKEINNNYEILIFGDILITFNASDYNIQSSPAIKAMTISRLFNYLNYDLQTLFDAEKIIQNAIDIEKKAILQIPFNESGFYQLWKGLLFFQEKSYQKALQQFESAQRFGQNHWRLDWYRALAYIGLQEKEQAKQLAQKTIEYEPNFTPAKEFLTTKINK